MPVPSQAIDVVDIDGIGESWWTKMEWAARNRNTAHGGQSEAQAIATDSNQGDRLRQCEGWIINSI